MGRQFAMWNTNSGCFMKSGNCGVCSQYKLYLQHSRLQITEFGSFVNIMQRANEARKKDKPSPYHLFTNTVHSQTNNPMTMEDDTDIANKSN